MGASGGAGSDGHCPFPDSDGWLRRGISWCAQKRRENIWGVTGQQVGHLLSGIQGKKSSFTAMQLFDDTVKIV